MGKSKMFSVKKKQKTFKMNFGKCEIFYLETLMGALE